MKILICGTFSSGKTTLAQSLARINKEFVLLPEKASMLKDVLPDLQWDDKYIRHYLYIDQLYSEEIMSNESRIIICDSGIEYVLAHDLYYFNYANYDLIKSIGHKRYDHVFLCSYTEVPLIDNGIRNTDRIMRKEIHTLIINTLEELNYSYTEIHGSVAERTNQIKRILDFLW